MESSSYQSGMNNYSGSGVPVSGVEINCSLSNGTEKGMVPCEEDLKEHVLRLSWPVFWLLAIILLVLLGNGVVCVSVWREPRLQNMFNFFIVSLAAGDLLDSVLVMPLAIAKAYLGTSSLYYYK